jgi:hypothetical protein
MNIDFGSIAGIIALLWTTYQQYALNKVCEKCPFRIKIESDKNNGVLQQES